MTNNNYNLDNGILIEGLKPEDLEKLQKSERNTGWERIFGAYQNNMFLRGEVVAIEVIAKKAVAVVSFEGIKGLIPVDLFGVRNIRQMRTYMGKEVAFTIENYDREAEVFTGSRVGARKIMAEHTLGRIDVGQATPFVITGIRSFGLFGDIGGLNAFIPVSEIRYGWIDDLHAEFKVGDPLMVKILEINGSDKKVDEQDKADAKEDTENSDDNSSDVDEYRIRVSAKALQDDPWDAGGKAHSFKKGNEYIGTVSGVVDYGVFIKLADGVDTLARHLRFESLERGDKVSVRVQDVDVLNKQVRSRIVSKIRQ